MNDQQLQQIFQIQQAIAAAATAAMINTLLNPQQNAANPVNQNALTESPTTPNTDYQEHDPQDNNNQTTPTPAITDLPHHHHHHNNHQRQDNQVAASIAAASAAATSSNMMIPQASSQSPNNHSNKKLKRHNQAPQAFSRQHNSPSSSSAFLPNNVGLPRKLVRGQDVWLGRGAEQTRQILKCMWCNQSFRTLAEMTQHMKITQHYTNIISQEQITSWKQPEGSDNVSSGGRQQSKQSISSKNLDEFHENTSPSEKSIDSEREDSFSNDDEPTPPPPPPPQQRQSRMKTRPERTTSNSNNSSKNMSINNNSTTTATMPTTATNTITNNNSNNTNESSNNTKSTEQQATDLETNDDQETNDENKCKRESTSREGSQDNNDECDKPVNIKKRPREDDSDADASTTNTDISVKQDPDAPKEGGGGGNGDPLSALETMVEKSFDPRMRPGMASGGILQRLGIDEEVCPPWQHINYANWYAAAAYGHPMAAALLAAGINLQNGIKLSKNMAPKKNDD
uniref:Protein tiptop n=1 Tax=Aceria tosichella TaxID=561515 RepID=A0A6G1SCD0_9ACAR